MGNRRVLGTVAALAVGAAALVWPLAASTAAADGPGVFLSGSHQNWVTSVSGPVVPQRMGSATSTTGSWAAGELVTVSGQSLLEVTTCNGTVGTTPITRSAGARSVSIYWSGAQFVSATSSQTTASRFYDPGPTGATWSIRGLVDETSWMPPGETYSVTFRAPAGPSLPGVAVQGDRLQGDACTSVVDRGNIKLTGNGVPVAVAEEHDPVADFVAVAAETDPNEIRFDNRSSDQDEDPLTFVWDFGDGTPTSTELNPVHRYERAGTYSVVLTATDDTERVGVAYRDVTVAGGLTVNSNGDGAAEDAADQGCDTGATIEGGAPECTLRAAIETANQIGGGDITFAIPATGTPVITAATPLPPITASTTVDGTSQEGGVVRVQGVGDATLALTGGTSTLTGLSLGGSEVAVQASGGSGHIVRGNRLGTDASGTDGDGSEVGVAVTVANVVVDANVTGAATGVEAGPAATDLQVVDNFLGVDDDGGTTIGAPAAGVVTAAPGAMVRGNVVRGSTVGVAVLTATAAGTSVTDNHVGVAGDGATALAGTGYGIRVDGTPDVAITGNGVVADTYSAILVAGSVQAGEEGGTISFGSPALEPADTPVTGGGGTIAANRIGLAGGTGVDGDATHGIASWAGATRLVVNANTVGGATGDAVQLVGGAGHRVTGNTLGTVAAPVGTGVALVDTDGAQVGGAGSAANTIRSGGTGVSATGSAILTRVEANRIAAVDGTSNVGIAIGADTRDATVTANAITGGASGITSAGERTGVADNILDGQTTVGISATGDGSTVVANSVVDGADGIVVTGDEATVEENRVGLAAGSDTVSANTGTGIGVADGKASVRRNVVAGSGTGGVVVAGTAGAELRSNRIWATTGPPIAVEGGPAAPAITAAIRSGSGGSLRRTLVLDQLPADDAGTIEVFAGDSCDDPEPRFLLEINRVKGAAERQRVIQVKGAASRDHFTVTYTTAAGRTSELSNCESAASYPDADGDGSVDPLDAFGGSKDDPTAAVVATDGEQLLSLAVAPYDAATDHGGGTFRNVAVGEDPAPGSHPAGWTLPYGALSFRVEGLAPGGRTTVALATLSGTSPIAGSSYWKYGPATPGANPSWFDFGYDAASDTGAQLTTTSIGGGFQRAWVLRLADGGRGDSDGGANGTITDPGGPVDGAIAPVDPPDPMPTVTTAPTGPSSTAPTGSGSGPVEGSGGAGGGSATAGALPRTGVDVGPAAAALLLVVAGAVFVGAARMRRRRMAVG